MGWLVAQQKSGLPVAGVHCHILDAAGHYYASRHDRLREYYELVDQVLGEIRTKVDDLLILSDHGMRVNWLDEDEPGVHSWRAMASSTINQPLPESAFDVAAWIENHTPDNKGNNEQIATMDTPTEHLQDLGYLS